MTRTSFLRGGVALALFAAAACDDGGTGPAAPASLVAMTATTQNAAVALPAPVPPAVRVSDSRGRGLVGVPVTFAVTGGGGTVDAQATTDAGGVAVAANWVMGTVAQENAVTASVPGVAPVVFRANAAAGEPATLEKAGGDAQSAAVGTALPDSIGVRVLDQYGNGVPGVPVNFTASGGTLSATRVATGAQGHARVTLALPTRPATIQVFAGSGALGPQVFGITVTAGAPAAVVRVAGEGQSGRSGTAVTVPPAVRVTDSFGNPVPGRPVAFAPAAGSGVVTGGAAVTNADGRAQVGSWVLGEPGTNRLEVTIADLAPIAFTATSRPACGNHSYTLFATVTAVLVPDGCVVAGRNTEQYSFTVPSAQCVEFRMNSAQFDTYLFLLDNGRNVLAQDDDGGAGLNSLIRWRVSAGTYYLGAAAYSNGQGGTFQLTSTAVSEGGWCNSTLLSQVSTQKEPR
ncbi:MAG TPA: DVUA0089 family protein [Longimicrobium sp.]|nr:DVUA0089 family protein [Longimicrobium sp.]